MLLSTAGTESVPSTRSPTPSASELSGGTSVHGEATGATGSEDTDAKSAIRQWLAEHGVEGPRVVEWEHAALVVQVWQQREVAGRVEVGRVYGK